MRILGPNSLTISPGWHGTEPFLLEPSSLLVIYLHHCVSFASLRHVGWPNKALCTDWCVQLYMLRTCSCHYVRLICWLWRFISIACRPCFIVDDLILILFSLIILQSMGTATAHWAAFAGNSILFLMIKFRRRCFIVNYYLLLPWGYVYFYRVF